MFSYNLNAKLGNKNLDFYGVRTAQFFCFFLGLHSDVHRTEFRFASVQEQINELLQMIVDTAGKSKNKMILWIVIQNHHFLQLCICDLSIDGLYSTSWTEVNT